MHQRVLRLIAADPHRHVDVFGHQVDEGVAQVQLQRQAGLGRQKRLEQGRQPSPSERGRRRDTQKAERLGRTARHHGLQILDPLQQLRRAVIDQPPGLGRGQTARGALDQPHAQPVLQPRQPARGHGGRQVEPPCGGGQAAFLQRTDEDFILGQHGGLSSLQIMQR